MLSPPELKQCTLVQPMVFCIIDAAGKQFFTVYKHFTVFYNVINDLMFILLELRNDRATHITVVENTD